MDNDSKPFYYLTFTPTAAVNGAVLINGFPLLRDAVPARIMWMEILNLHLIAKSNVINLDLRALSGEPFALRLQLRRFSRDEVVTPDSGAAVLLNSPRPNPTGTLELTSSSSGRLETTFNFRSPEFDYSSVYVYASQPAADQAEAVAQSLHKAFENGDVGACLALQAAKLDDYALSYGMARDEMFARIRREFATALANGANPVDKGQPWQMLSWCGGRLLEPVFRGNEPFLMTRPGPNGLAEIRVFIGDRDGRVQVIR